MLQCVSGWQRLTGVQLDLRGGELWGRVCGRTAEESGRRLLRHRGNEMHVVTVRYVELDLLRHRGLYNNKEEYLASQSKHERASTVSVAVLCASTCSPEHQLERQDLFMTSQRALMLEVSIEKRSILRKVSLLYLLPVIASNSINW